MGLGAREGLSILPGGGREWNSCVGLQMRVKSCSFHHGWHNELYMSTGILFNESSRYVYFEILKTVKFEGSSKT